MQKKQAKGRREKSEMAVRGWHELCVDDTDVFVTNVFEQLELSVGTLGENGSGKRFHDLLDGNRGACELVVCGADQTESAHADGLQVDISGGDLKDGTKNGELDKVGHVGTRLETTVSPRV